MLVIERDVVRAHRQQHEVRLPKGHVEDGETDREAAVREVAEETGYHRTEILADLGTFANQFERSDGTVLRHEHYYLMRVSSTEQPKPAPVDSEEALFENVWTDPADAAARLTFDAERRFVHLALAVLKRSSA